MKKALVLAAALALFAAPALAAITNTAHDLSSGNATNDFRSTNVDEICVFCHTPHGADTSVTDAPLWNRTATSVATDIYLGTDIDAIYDLASVNQTDAPLCLSCHDGASLTSDLNNPPNGVATINWNSGEIADPAETLIGSDLSNDHPIGFAYDAAQTLDAELVAMATAVGNGVQFFGADNNMMWCSSCHDVHGVTGVDTFLLKSNAGSALCLTCHEK